MIVLGPLLEELRQLRRCVRHQAGKEARGTALGKSLRGANAEAG